MNDHGAVWNSRRIFPLRAGALAAAMLTAAPGGLRAQSALEDLRRQASGAAADSLPPALHAPAVPADAVQAIADPETSGRDEALYRRIAEAIGFSYPYAVTKQHLGGFWKAANRISFSDGRRRVSVVLKTFSRLMSAKWLYSPRDIPGRRILMNPKEAFQNNLDMDAAFRQAGLKTPEIVAAFPDQGILATRFLEGAVGMEVVAEKAVQGDESSVAILRRLGASLADVHRGGLCMMDMGIGNTMVKDGEIYYVDLDQAALRGPLGWDLAEFVYDMSRYAQGSMDAETEGHWREAVRAFLGGYRANGGDPGVLREAASPVYKKHYIIASVTRGHFSALKTLPLVEDELQAAAAAR